MEKPGRILQLAAGVHLLVAAGQLHNSIEAHNAAMEATSPAVISDLGDIREDSSEQALIEYGMAVAMFAAGVAINKLSDQPQPTEEQ